MLCKLRDGSSSWCAVSQAFHQENPDAVFAVDVKHATPDRLINIDFVFRRSITYTQAGLKRPDSFGLMDLDCLVSTLDCLEFFDAL